jgi:hypothetical protein
MLEGQRQLRRQRRRREDNIKMDMKVMEWNCVDCIVVAQCRDLLRALTNAMKNFQFP